MARRVVLYVEDDDAAFLTMQLALQEFQAPIELYRAADGDQALAFVRQSAPYQDAPRPNLILLDLNLPKRSGMEVLAELKSDESLRSIPVIIFSSSSRATDRNQSLKLGAEEYVTKPSSFERFVETVQRACSRESEAGGEASSRAQG
jgi:CheY-like chemotaxis protein